MKTRDIHIHTHSAPQPKGRPILFVHGAYTHSGCWQEFFIPFFQSAGHDCYTLDLSGHGASRGRRQRLDFGIDDYVADLAEARASLPVDPVLIGHSMGCTVVQRHLECATAPAVAFLAPVPPSGTIVSACRLSLLYPDYLIQLEKAVSGHPTAETVERMSQVYLSPKASLDEINRFFGMVQPESQRALLDLAALPLRRYVTRPEIPTLVMGGAEDAVFPAGQLYTTALPWRARSVVVQDAGHMLMIDPGWEQAAQALRDWLATL
ncbi:MAG TPA: alpha/beta hydrolase [Acetobacteraceae bacterium]|nr:alpha/beta hydrolase [Acetobacteraceae bacterium]